MKEGWHDRFVYRWHFDGRPVEKLSVGFAPEGKVHAGDILRRGNSAQEVLQVESHYKYIKESPYPVGPGWWALLDTEIPQLYEIDPDLTGLEIKEKYGACQVDCCPSETHLKHRDLLGDVASAIESQSAITCENCGAHITVKPSPETPYCERCYNLPTAERFAVREETKENYFRGSYLRQGEPKDRSAVRGKVLGDFLIDSIVQSVAGSMALSDMELTDEDKERIRLAADDPEAAERIVQQLIEKHKRKKLEE